MRKSLVLMLIMCFLLPAAITHASNPSYLTLEGAAQGAIEGDVTNPRREGTIEIVGFSHSVSAPRDAATGLPTGKRQHQPIRITKRIDKTTPLLLRAWGTNEVMSRFKLDFYQPNREGEEELYYTIVLRDARILSVQQETPLSLLPDNVPLGDMEYITFIYREISWEYPPTGSIFETTWDYQQGAEVPLSDLSGDGLVNLVDLTIMAQEWMQVKSKK